jgi:hypothetical protein
MVEEPIGGPAMPEKGDASQEEVKELTDQFYVTLRAYVARLDKEDESRSPKSFKQIEDLLKEGGTTWSDGPDRFKPGPADGEGADQVRASGRGQAKTESRSSDPAAPPSARTVTEPPR